MNYDSWVTTVGTVVTLLAAILTVWQTKKAISSAISADMAQKKVLALSKISNLSILKTQCVGVRDDFRKYTSAEQLAGVDFFADMKKMQILVENIHDSGELTRLKGVPTIISDIAQMLDHLGKAKTPDQALVPGKVLYEKSQQIINAISSEISSSQGDVLRS